MAPWGLRKNGPAAAGKSRRPRFRNPLNRQRLRRRRRLSPDEGLADPRRVHRWSRAEAGSPLVLFRLLFGGKVGHPVSPMEQVEAGETADVPTAALHKIVLRLVTGDFKRQPASSPASLRVQTHLISRQRARSLGTRPVRPLAPSNLSVQASPFGTRGRRCFFNFVQTATRNAFVTAKGKDRTHEIL